MGRPGSSWNHGRPRHWYRATGARRFFTVGGNATISLHACRLGSVTAAIRVPKDAADTGTGTGANSALDGQLVSDRAVPAGQGDQIAAAISGHQPGGPANGARRDPQTQWPLLVSC